jgi:hypothetical protein
MPTPNPYDLVDAVKRHANAHYEQDGWDLVVETMDDEDLYKLVRMCGTMRGAIRVVKAHVKVVHDYRNDIINS